MIASYEKYEAIRDLHGLTDYAVAQKSGITTATISSWKTGRYIPKLDKLFRISQALGCSIDDLITEEA